MSILFNISYSSQYIGESRLYLYNRGDLCTSVTGGWSNPLYYSSSYNIPWNFGENYMYSNTARSGCASYLMTNYKIDFSGYTNLYIKYDNAEQRHCFLSTQVGSQGYMYNRTNTISGLYQEYYIDQVHFINESSEEDYVEDIVTYPLDNNNLLPLVTVDSINEPYHLGVFIYPQPSGSISHIYEIYLE